MTGPRDNPQKKYIEALEADNARLRVENEILLEGCAILREVACNYAPVVAHATPLQKTIYLVMKDRSELDREIDRRIEDPKRTWWNESLQSRPSPKPGSGEG
ncbi:MAG: hypothetical protein LC118_20665 [Dehalococcoidia bacterium]|nr:hypothetical protein [Dehalococcoidia bacterium]